MKTLVTDPTRGDGSPPPDTGVAGAVGVGGLDRTVGGDPVGLVEEMEHAASNAIIESKAVARRVMGPLPGNAEDGAQVPSSRGSWSLRARRAVGDGLVGRDVDLRGRQEHGRLGDGRP